MSYTYSLIIELRRRGLSYREISKTLHVSQATVARVLKQKASRKNSVMRKTQGGVFKAQSSGTEGESAFQPSQKSVLVNRRGALSDFEGLEKAKSAFQQDGLGREVSLLHSESKEALSSIHAESYAEAQKGVYVEGVEKSAFQPSLKSAFDRPSFLISSPEALSGFREAELLRRVSWLEEEVRRLHEALAREQAISYELSQRVKELEQALPKTPKKRWWHFW